MNDERMHSVLEEWFKARDAAPDDVRRSARHVAELRPQVHQRSRWWPFPIFHRRAKSPTTNDTTDHQPGPNPATNGHTPTVIGRTQSMLSPVKAITAGALVFAIGGAFLIAQPFDQQGNVPGAATDAVTQDDPNMEAAEVTGLEDFVEDVARPDGEQVGDALLGEDLVIRHSWDMDDARLSGVRTTTMNYGWHRDSGFVIEVMTVELANDGGSWVGEARGYGSGEKASFFALDGRDGYEGLSAFVLLEYFSEGGSELGSLRGVIFPAALPEVPEPYVGE